MITGRRVSIALLLLTLFGIGQLKARGAELTKADIPSGMSPDLKALIEDTFSQSAEKRRKAVSQLGDQGDKLAPAMPFIVRLLNDPDGSVVGRAAWELGDALNKYPALRETPGLDQAVVRFSENADANVRADAARLIARSHLPNAFDLLVKMLKDPDINVRRHAIDALGDLGDQRAQRILVEIVLTCDKQIDNHLQEGCAAEESLGKLGNTSSLHLLLYILQTRSTPIAKGFIPLDMREGAVRGLGLLRDPEAIRPLEAVLKNKLGQPYEVRAGAARALAAIQGPEAAPLLRQFAIDLGEQRDVRRNAALALVEVTGGEVDDAEIVTAICLPAPDTDDRALLAIARRGKTKAVRAAAQSFLSERNLEVLRKEGLFVTPHDASEKPTTGGNGGGL